MRKAGVLSAGNIMGCVSSNLTLGKIMQNQGRSLQKTDTRVLEESLLRRCGLKMEPLYLIEIRDAVKKFAADPVLTNEIREALVADPARVIGGWRKVEQGFQGTDYLHIIASNAPLVPVEHYAVLHYAAERIIGAVESISDSADRNHAAMQTAYGLVGIAANTRPELRDMLCAGIRQRIAGFPEMRQQMIAIMKDIQFGDGEPHPKQMIVVDLVSLTKEELDRVEKEAKSQYVGVLAGVRYEEEEARKQAEKPYTFPKISDVAGRSVDRTELLADIAKSHTETAAERAELEARLAEHAAREQSVPDAGKPEDSVEPAAPPLPSEAVTKKAPTGPVEPVRAPDPAARTIQDAARKSIEELDSGLLVEEVSGQPIPTLPSAGARSVSESMIVEKHESRALDAALFNAIDKGDLAAAEGALKAGANVDASDSNLATPLIRAAVKGDCNMASLLLKHRADKDASDRDGNTALIRAVIKNDLAMANLLLLNNVKRDIRNRKDETAISIAESCGNPEMAELLKTGRMPEIIPLTQLKRGADEAAKTVEKPRPKAPPRIPDDAKPRLEIIEPEVEPYIEPAEPPVASAAPTAGKAGTSSGRAVTDSMIEEEIELDTQEERQSQSEIRLTDSVLFALMVQPGEEIIELSDSDLEMVEGLEGRKRDEDGIEQETTAMFRAKKGLPVQAGRKGPQIDMEAVMSQLPDGTRIQMLYADGEDVPQQLKDLFPPGVTRYVMDYDGMKKAMKTGAVSKDMAIGMAQIKGRKMVVFDKPVPGTTTLTAVDLQYELTPDGEMQNVRRKTGIGSINSDKSILELLSGVKARSEDEAKAAEPAKPQIGSLRSDDSIMELFTGIPVVRKNKGKSPKKKK